MHARGFSQFFTLKMGMPFAKKEPSLTHAHLLITESMMKGKTF